MRKIVITFLMVIGFGSIVLHRITIRGIGLRGGFESGLTLKHFTSEKSAIES